MRKISLARMVAGVLLTIASFTVAAPAYAAEKNIYAGGEEPRCFKGHYAACLYFLYSKDAYWPANTSWKNLQGHYFWEGTGFGEGTVVYHNSYAMSCGTTVGTTLINECRSFTDFDYVGSSDYLFGNAYGGLYYTKDKNASLRITDKAGNIL